MSQLAYKHLGSCRDVIKIAQERCLENRNLHAYAKEIVRIAGSMQLPQREIIELALYIGLKVFPRDKTFQNYLKNPIQVITGLPEHWIPSLHSEYFSLAYHNPDDLLEYIAKTFLPTLVGFLI